MQEMDRRIFFKFGLAVAAGVAINEATSPFKIKLDEGVRQVTGHPTGNAGQLAELEEDCKDTSDKLGCYKNFEYSTANKVYATTAAPIIEETQYRGMPSLMLSRVDGREKPLKDMLIGTDDGIRMTRKELLVGIVTSFLFGLTHNITGEGLNIKTVSVETKTIPASIIFSGGIYWYLQRKFGIVSNIAAHTMHNFKAIRYL